MLKNIIHPTLALLGVAKSYKIEDPHQYRHLGPPPMLIEEFLPEGSVMGVTALPGVGKSWLVMEAMRAVATGTKMMGEFQAKRGGVLFVGSDASLYDYARQWRRLTEDEYTLHHAAGDHAEIEPNVPYESVRWLIQSSFLFEDPKEICNLLVTHECFEYGEPEPIYEDVYTTDEQNPEKGRLVRHQVDFARPRGFKLIVFDTLSRLTRAQQNDNTEMERVFGNIRLISEVTGASVLLVHHNSKPSEFNDGSDWRGAMSQIGALDAWVNIGAKKNDKATLACNFKKFRGITPGDFRYRMNVTEEARASLVYLDEFDSRFEDPEEGPLPLAIRSLLATMAPPEGMSITEISDALWPQFKDLFDEQPKFAKAVRNRLSEKRSPLHKHIRKIKGSNPVRYILKENLDVEP